MKLSWGFALASLYSAASATDVGHVYILDPTPRPAAQASSSVDPETARLILALRFGLSRFHSIDNPSDETVQQINAFGGRQQKLFGEEDAERTQAQLLIWVDGVVDATVLADAAQWTSGFTISSPPSTLDNHLLLRDMAQQATSVPPRADPNGTKRAAIRSIDSVVTPLTNTLTIYNDLLLLLSDAQSITTLARLLPNLISSAAGPQGYSITLVAMPPSSSHAKRAANPWGTYAVPHLQSRREATEAPLTPSTAEPASASNPVPDLEDFPTIMQSEGNNTTPPLGILPSCFASQSECETKTHSCSGHGSCGLFRPAGSDRKDCYACKCEKDVKFLDGHGMEEKIQTTYWGGPACQKQDVSVPFWLFVGSGVLLTFLITTGIGMLYSMGSEELPSVIGAGVSGPVRK